MKSFTITGFVIVATLLLTGERCSGGLPPRLIEVQTSDATHLGRVISMSDNVCRLRDRFGRMAELSVSKVQSIRVVSEQFRPASAGEMRDLLRQEFPDYDVQSSTHYLVVTPRGRGDAYVRLFENTFRQVELFFRSREFRVTSPENTLVAIVFATRAEFDAYCRRDDIPSGASLQGYYSLRSNRVALYDDPALMSATSRSAGEHEQNAGAVVLQPSGHSGPDAERLAGMTWGDGRMIAAISGAASNVIVHEATHQVGHNIGIHSRVSRTPLWLMEGLATVLEAPGMRNRSEYPAVESRQNPERMNWFRTQYAQRRQPGDLASVIASDELFARQTLDAYSLAWAVAWFLSENPARTHQFARYIHIVESRNAAQAYTAEERLKDFQNSFGDISRLEIEFLRFMDQSH